MESKVSKIIISFFGLTFLIFVYLFSAYQDKWLFNYGSVTEGKITEASYAAYNFVYNVNGFEHNLRIKPPFKGLQIGEYYKILYDPNNPDNSTVDLETPIIKIENEFITTKSLSIRKLWGNDAFSFSYMAENVLYERIQRFRSKNRIDKNKIYKVKYNKSNPEIAYLNYTN